VGNFLVGLINMKKEHHMVKIPLKHIKMSQLNSKSSSEKLPLMPGTKKTDIIFISMDLYHFGRPVAEAFLLCKYQLMCWILQHILHHNTT